MKQVQIKLTIILHRIRLQVRFPCTVAAFVKIESEEVQISDEVPLKTGEALFDQKSFHQFTSFYDGNRNLFVEKKVQGPIIQISLLVYLKSSSGRIPAGNAVLSLSNLKKGLNRLTIGIEKCPDKGAIIEVSLSYEIISEFDIFSNQDLGSKKNSRSELNQPQLRVNREKNNYLNDSRFSRDQKNSENGNKINKFSQLIIKGNDQQIRSQRDKIVELERQKLQANREIRQLRGEIIGSSQSRAHSEVDKNGSEAKQQPGKDLDREVSEKSGAGLYEKQTSSRKFKNDNLEKEYKTLLRKYQQLGVETKALTTKKQLAQKLLREIEGQYKAIKQKYEDNLMIHQNYTKRMEYKQNSYKQQIKGLSQKFSNSQTEKQKMIFEKNDLVLQFQEREKSLRANFREKQKIANQQRGKLLRKIESLTKQLTDKGTSASDFELKINDLVMESKADKRKIEELQLNTFELSKQIQKLNEILGQQRTNKQQVQEALLSQKQLQQERKKLKKLLTEKQQQLAKQSKNYANLEVNYNKVLKKSQQSENSLKEKLAALKVLQREYDSLARQHELLKKSVQEKNKAIEEVTFMKQNETMKINNLNDQFKDLQKKYQQQTRNLRRELKEKENSIKTIKEELNENSQEVASYTQKITDLQKQNQQLQLTLQEKQAQLEALQNEKEEFLSANAELGVRIHELEVQMNNLAIKNNDQINKKAIKIKQLQQKILSLSEQSRSTEEQKEYELRELKNKYNLSQSTLKDYQTQIKELKENIFTFERQELKHKSKYQELQYEIKIGSNQIVFLKETIDKANKDLSSSIAENKELSVKIQQMNRQIDYLKSEMQKTQNLLDNVQQSGISTKQSWEVYKARNLNSIKSALALLSKSQVIDQKCIEHQEQAIKSELRLAAQAKNHYIRGVEQEISRLETAISSEQQDNLKLRDEIAGLTDKVEGLEAQLQKERQRLAKTVDYSADSQKKAKEQIQFLISSNSNLLKELEALDEVKVKLEQDIEHLNDSLNEKGKQNKVLQSNIVQLQRLIKEKTAEFLNNEVKKDREHQKQIEELTNQLHAAQKEIDNQNNSSGNLNAKLNKVTEEWKQYQSKAQKNLEDQAKEIQRLDQIVVKQRKQIEEKNSQLAISVQTEKQLRENIKILNQQIKKIKQTVTSLTTKNDKDVGKIKQLESFIANLKKNQGGLSEKQAQLEKALKERASQIISLKENIYKFEREKIKLAQDLEISNKLIKVKEDAYNKLLTNLQELKSQLQGSNQKLKEQEKRGKEKYIEGKKQIKQLSVSKEALEKQLKETLNKLQAAQNQLQKESKSNSQALQALTKQNNSLSQQSKDYKIKSRQLEEKVVSMTKFIDGIEKTHKLEEDYLKPLKEGVIMIRCHMNEYARVGDQFEASKNKLLKLSTNKLEVYNDKYYSDKIRDVNLAFLKLKNTVLGKLELNEEQKLGLGEEMKKVQIVLEKILKFDR